MHKKYLFNNKKINTQKTTLQNVTMECHFGIPEVLPKCTVSDLVVIITIKKILVILSKKDIYMG